MKKMDEALRAAGFGVIEFNKPNKDEKTDSRCERYSLKEKVRTDREP